MLRKNETGLMARSGEAENAKGEKNFGLTLRILAAGGLGYLGYRFADFFQSFGGGSTLYLLTALLASALVLGIGIVSLLKNMYMSSDIESLITLPFSSEEIAILRVLSYLQGAVINTVVLLIPIQVGFSVRYVQPISVYAAVVLSCIMIPVFVTGVLASVIIALMAFVTLMRNLEVLRYIGAVFGFAAALGYFFLTGMGEIKADEIFSQAAAFSEKIKNYNPVAGLTQTYLETGSVLYLLCALLLTAAAVGVFLIASRALYLRGALNMQSARIGKRLRDSDFDRYCRKKTQIDALTRKEYRMVRRNPVFFANNFLYGFLWPLVVLILMKKVVPIFTTLIDQIQTAENGASFWTDPATFTVVTPIMCAAATFIVWIPLISETLAYSALSREGKSFFVMKQIPVTYKDQLKAKLRMADRFAQVTTTGYSIILLLLFAIIIGMPAYYIVIPLVMIVLYTAEFEAADLLLGIHAADVSWDNEKQAATKSKTMVAMIDILQLAVPALFGVLAVLPWYAGLPAVAQLAGVLAVGVALLFLRVLLVRKIYTSGEKKIRRLRF